MWHRFVNFKEGLAKTSHMTCIMKTQGGGGGPCTPHPPAIQCKPVRNSTHKNTDYSSRMSVLVPSNATDDTV